MLGIAVANFLQGGFDFACLLQSLFDGLIFSRNLGQSHIGVARGAGFLRLADEYETGFHPGQTDDPATELKKLLADNPGREFIPYIIGAGQFDVTWGFLARTKEE